VAMSRRDPLTAGDYHKVVERYHHDSDRAAAVLAAAFIEGYFEDYLRTFTNKEKEVEELFGKSGPLGAFEAKAKCAYVFGYIPKNIYIDINNICKVRNIFAHSPKVNVSFIDNNIKTLCDNLSMAKLKFKEDDALIHLKKPRIQYLLTISMIVGHMHNTMLQANRIDK
jgi:DNA-binding MltR family transcriptional regulator